MSTIPGNNPDSPDISDIPPGINLIGRNNDLIQIGDLTAHTYSTCCIKKDAKLWSAYSLAQDLWLEQASDETIFRFLRRDFDGILSPSGLGSNKMDELQHRAINFIWSKNPELVNKYPNFEGITRLTEAEKLGHTETKNKLWVSLSLYSQDEKGVLRIHTRPDGDEGDYVMHFYNIEEDGKAIHKYSMTQGEINIQNKQGETQRAVLNSLLQEANGDLLKIAQAHLAHALVQKAKYGSK